MLGSIVKILLLFTSSSTVLLKTNDLIVFNSSNSLFIGKEDKFEKLSCLIILASESAGSHSVILSLLYVGDMLIYFSSNKLNLFFMIVYKNDAIKIRSM